MKCANCKKHKATERWLGEGNMMDFVHGNYEWWCKCCCLKAQIKHTKERARALKGLLKELKKLKCL